MAGYFTLFDVPALIDPVLVAAFKGWNDAAEAASASVSFMVDTWSAQTVARCNPEDLYDFTETRPHVRLTDGVSREIVWPSLDVYVRPADGEGRDVVLLVGHEPQLRWPTFTREVLDLLDRLEVRQVALLGALLADVPHTRAARLSGSASSAAARSRLEGMDVALSRYEGPTGIVGVLQDACARHGMETISLWGSVPHYITASPNPQVSAALLRHVSAFFNLELDVAALDRQSKRFRTRVDEAISQSPEAAAYVRELEGRAEDPDSLGEHSSLPTGPEVVRALEEFLRQQRSDDE